MNSKSLYKVMCMFMALAMLLGVLAACTTPPPAAAPAKPPKIGYIAAGTEYYYQCQESGIRKKAKEMGVDLTVLNSEGKADKEISNMEDMISKKMDAILIMTTNAAAGQKALQLANKANIPVILVGINVEAGPASHCRSSTSTSPTWAAPPVSG